MVVTRDRFLLILWLCSILPILYVVAIFVSMVLCSTGGLITIIIIEICPVK